MFILGAAGYVGGTLLVSLAKSYPKTTFSALVRASQDAQAVSSIGPNVRAVPGSHADLDLIKLESSNAEVVFQVSDPDDLAMAQAIISGLEIHKSRTGKRKILFHTTGTATIKDHPTGEITGVYPAWDDTNKDLLRAIDIAAPPRIVDLELRQLTATHTNTFTCLIFTRMFLGSRRGSYFGKGTNIWSNIHVQDLVSVFHFLFARALQTERREDNTWDGFDSFYFATASEHEWGHALRAVGRAVYKRGLLDSPEVESIPVNSNPVLALFSGQNSRAKSTCLSDLGWIPKEKSILETVDDDIGFTVKFIKERPEAIKSWA